MKKILSLAILLLLIAPWPTYAAERPASDVSLVNQESRRVLILTMNESGGTYEVETGTLINIQIPYTPYAQVYYDPAVLQQRAIVEPQYDYPMYGWEFLAVRRGVSPLTISFDVPCHFPPCPMPYRQNSFNVTIIVRSRIPPPTPFPPQPPILRTDVYISTAYLDQMVQVSTGQVIALELPYLTGRQPVTLQYDRTVLNLVSGQATSYQQGGWRFTARQRGTTTITVNNGSQTYFRVRIVVN